jgi:glycosyltransferase involved in cell wall biosynthesis
VTDGVNGLLVRPRDVGSLAEALGRVLQDSNLRVRLGAAGRCKAEAEFDLKLVVRATLELYHELLETKP